MLDNDRLLKSHGETIIDQEGHKIGSVCEVQISDEVRKEEIRPEGDIR